MPSEIVVHGLLLVLLVSGIPLLFACVVGLFLGVLQAATQVQEQSVSFLFKFLMVAGSLALFGPWMYQQLEQFACETLLTISRYSHLR